jgi:hypothetical protein
VGRALAENINVTAPEFPIEALDGTVTVIFWPETATTVADTPLTVTSEAVGLEGTVVPKGKLTVMVLVPPTRAPSFPVLKATE